MNVSYGLIVLFTNKLSFNDFDNWYLSQYIWHETQEEQGSNVVHSGLTNVAKQTTFSVAIHATSSVANAATLAVAIKATFIVA